MKTVFYSEDGKAFDSNKECLEYEEKLIAKKEAEKKKAEEKAERKKFVEEAYNNYIKALNEYLNDYGSYSNKFNNEEYSLMDTLLKALGWDNE